MSIMPEGDDLRKAIKWISEERDKNPDIKLEKLINEAGIRFDLPPNDTDFL
ncbi:MAG: hypothetical protein HN379_04475, partial [Desulfobacteraceae bacterium]|nr:hypothetical protein [Desulfobacteraceae bacterium]